MLELHWTVPDVSEAEAATALREHWGLSGRLRPLSGERDRNYHVATDDGREFVLKFATGSEDRSLVDLQNAALDHVRLRACGVPTPRVVRATNGGSVVEYGATSGRYFARVLEWVPGQPLSQWRAQTPALLRELGASLGAVSWSLEDFAHPAASRTLKWDLAKADWITEHIPLIEDPARRALVTRISDDFAARVRPALATLRRGVTYNDANDHNVLVVPDADGDGHISGIIDFGDLVESCIACDLAIALAYAMMGKPDPISAAASVVAGFHSEQPLEPHEIAMLLPLARTRLAVSVVNSTLQRSLVPENAYLQVSEAGAWRLLEQLESEHDRYVEYRFREACGLTPCAVSGPVSGWIDAHRAEFAPIVDHLLEDGAVHVHDFSPSSTEIGNLDVWRDQARFAGHIESVIDDAGAKVGISRYDEVRAIYTSDMFRSMGNEGPEWRTVHLGIDVNCPVGAPVYAPLAGVVHSIRDNNATPGDYGPTVVLEHRVQGGAITFWTLYGHLNRASLTHLKEGDTVSAGDTVGWIGDRTVNGGWWYHVHFQLICDMLDRVGDYPGVSRPIDRDVWLSLSPDPCALLRIPSTGRAERASTVKSLLTRRKVHLGPSLSVSYRRPLNIDRGMMQFLISSDGRRYLDGVNNVAHVGHAHPDVVRAGQRQMAALNTNTRYLHDLLLRYASRLTATLPAPLEVCYFVCSGSEANELALRLARAHTKARDMIVVDAAYHGNTSTLVEISPYKFDGPGGSGAPDWVHKAPMPDVYRGAFRSDDPEAGLKYAQGVRSAVGRVIEAGRRPAAFICESVLSCGGQIVLPDGYLKEAYRHARAAKAVCIADEVQVGFGRVGSHMWAFDTQGVIPDIVTMGKPIGNGHPMAAVVTTREIATSFTNGMEFFSSFGGNPVSCAIGLEVLNVIEREELTAQARRVGDHLMTGLRGLMDAHALIGDVRGLGLFVGVEFVTDRDQRSPATAQARYVANRMRDLGVLVSTDGPDNNVIKIKPPLCFSEANADFMVEMFGRVLAERSAHADAAPYVRSV